MKKVYDDVSYDATNFPTPVEYQEAPWRMYGMEYSEMGNVDPEDLTQVQLREHGMKAVKQYWNAIPADKKFKSAKNFDAFVKQVFHDPVHGDVIEEFIYDLGFMHAVYEQSSQYDPQVLKEEFVKAGQKLPTGQIPMAHTIGNPINRAAQDVGIFNWNIWKSTGEKVYDEYKVPVALALGGYAAYKILIAVGGVLAALALFKRG